MLNILRKPVLGIAASAAVLASIAALPAAAAPSTAADQVVAVYSGSTVWVDVLANDAAGSSDTMVDGATLKVVSQPTAGWAAIDPFTNQLTYIAPSYWAGTVTVTYEVLDTAGERSTGTVTFTVAAPENMQ